MPTDVTVFGGADGYAGNLANNGEALARLYPDHPDVIGGRVTSVSWIAVDE